ncbi:COP23 domain-containing protein [Nostoc favosum]|uniref:COP23 domain-containing protein n=1 Tax=Nostoc favosum CHAB5714 TaxID=2780399 RepID=A0ABS8IBW0_9NOSO|nr:COP23 domain-containing protein [Nostoc favosum]MCC5601354.1 COP23 domain-containing protein [Nostoc favosum CHAB5714]
MSKKFSDSFLFQFLIMPVGGIIVAVILGLLIAPLGRWFTKTPIIGTAFEQLCHATNANCSEPPDLNNNPSAAQTVNFLCAKTKLENIPATIARTPTRGNVEFIRWESKHFIASGYDPVTRCLQVSERFQKLWDKNLLKYITYDRINNYNVICVSLEANTPCIQDGLLLTLRPEDNPKAALKQILNIRNNESTISFHNSDTTEQSENKLYINVSEILDKNPVVSNNPIKPLF